MKRWIAPIAGLMIAGAAAVPVFAQSQSSDSAPQPADSSAQADDVLRGRGAGPGMLICSTSNPTDTVAQVLGMTPAELRLALVSGKTVTQLAADKSVDLQTIQDALSTQRKADLDQALADGLITQTQYDAITTAMDNAPAVTGTARFGIRLSPYNQVDREAAAAEALGMSCADLVKAEQAGSAIAQIATDKGVDVQTVIDAVTKAYTDAFAADVKEGLITQAQADGRMTNLTVQIGQWVYDTHNGRGDGFGMGMGNGPMGGPGQQGGFGQPGQRGNQDGMNGQGGPMGGFGQRGNQNGMGGQNMPNPPSGFGQPNAPTAPQQPDATSTPNA